MLDEMRIMMFRLGQTKYALDVNLVKAIENIHPVEVIKNDVPYIKGVMSLRGRLIPVLSLRKRFELPETANTNTTKFLVTAIHEMEIALIVDEVLGIHDISQENQYKPPVIATNRNTSFLGKILNTQNGLVLNLEADHILTANELNSVQEMMNKRNKKSEKDAKKEEQKKEAQTKEDEKKENDLLSLKKDDMKN